jgi:hypothetical protein
VSLSLKPIDPFTGFLSLKESEAVEVIKSECVAAALSGEKVAKIMQKIPVQLFIRRVLVRGDTRTMELIIEIGYKPATAEDIWMIKESSLLTDMISEKFPELEAILRKPLNRTSLTHQAQVKDYLHNLGTPETKISQPTDFKPNAQLLHQFQNLFKSLFN